MTRKAVFAILSLTTRWRVVHATAFQYQVFAELVRGLRGGQQGSSQLRQITHSACLASPGILSLAGIFFKF